MRSYALPLVACSLAMAGCARVSTTTDLRADGSYSRKVVYTVSDMNQMPMPFSDSSGKQKNPEMKPEDLFSLPAAANGVKLVRGHDKNGVTVTVTRELPAGAAALQDIGLKGQDKQITATSTVIVRKLPNGNLEYIESLHGLKQSTSAQQFATSDLRAKVKSVIPAEYQKTELIDRLTRDVLANLVHALFGPPEPKMSSFFLSPEVAARKVNSEAFVANIQSFKDAIPALTDAQARSMARALPNLFNPESMDPNAASTPSSSGDKSDPNDMTPLFFEVSFPGRIVETNGISDAMTGTVYWSLTPISLQVGDVQLRLVVQP